MKAHILNLIAGVVFGLANVIPGVSGGTMAVVFGVYEKLIGLIANLKENLKKEIPFICVFGVGAGVGILGFGNVMDWVLANFPVLANAFFIGVILGSIPMLVKLTFKGEKKYWTYNWKNIIPCLITFAVMIPMALAGDGEEAKAAAEAAAAGGNVVIDMIKSLLGGVVAASCMIIPGISGSFVMLLMGMYGTIISAVANLNLLVLAPFGIGAVLGLLFCAKLIKWLLAKFAMPTYSAILGFVFGSILCIFPGWAAMLNIGPIIACVLGLAAITLCNKFSPEE